MENPEPQKTRKPGSGGYRPTAGRKPAGGAKEGKLLLTVRLPAELVRLVTKQAPGGRSAFVERALRHYQATLGAVAGPVIK